MIDVRILFLKVKCRWSYARAGSDGGLCY